ncbi:arginyltransferase (plasmid) [Pseudorhodobacter turbinis]|uniref:Aspartate/glutamate leucyltransferase n=1 Tax=Pseudorhodobacter turbinis TaxID=2500533 RepID=A0A4P8EIH0_9RHOB|nr:arginyltransferase [Pseudorhodobacter turbinis]QCO56757.1 arginyltransferase [Pseudorhodobacter turbinis]
MRHTLPLAPQFYVTAPQPCPYLEGRMERKLFTALQGEHAQKLNDSLSKQGFRRSQNVLYRPSCAECSACMSARIRVADFVPTRTQRKVLRRNAPLQRKATSPWATEEQFALFRRYLEFRHATGGMADMDIYEFAAMIEETPIRSRVIEYSQADGTGPSELSAVCLTDVFDDGLSMVYSFYEPDLISRSLGTFLILDHIEIAREAGLPFVYLGYWVPGSKKMGYKAGFSGLEIYKAGDWQPIGNPEDHNAELNPLSVDPIAEQVARINLPDGRATREAPPSFSSDRRTASDDL